MYSGGVFNEEIAINAIQVSADDTVKIGDFGMARDIYYHEYYKPTGMKNYLLRK